MRAPARSSCLFIRLSLDESWSYSGARINGAGLSAHQC